MTHYWFWKVKLGERNGQQCRILAHGKMNSILVEFADGYRVITSRYAVRRITSRLRRMAKKTATAQLNRYHHKEDM